MFSLWRSKLRPLLQRSVPRSRVLRARLEGPYQLRTVLSCTAYDRIRVGWSPVRASRYKVSVFCRNALRMLNDVACLVWREPVMLQAMKEEPPLAAKCKDKFLIQSTTITPEKETLSLADIVSSSSLLFLAICHPVANIWTSLSVSRNVSVYVMTTYSGTLPMAPLTRKR